MTRTANTGLDHEGFATAFPFHIELDRGLQIVQLGSSMRRICPSAVSGHRFADHFRQTRPLATSDYESLASQTDRLVVLGVEGTKVKLRGQWVQSDSGERLLFLGSPWLTDPTEMARSGLSVGDFALHDPVVDFLQVVQAQKMAFADVRKLADRLARQREELRLAHAKLAEQHEALQEAKAFILGVLETADEGIVSFDESGALWTLNPEARRMLRVLSEDVIGQSITRFLPDVLGAGVVLPGLCETTARRIDGSQFPCEVVVGNAILGRVPLRTCFIRDISVRKEFEAEILRSREAAVKASLIKSQFLASVSHEIRTPMNGVLGMTTLLQDSPLTEEQREYVGVIHASSVQLLELINDILDLAKLEAHKLSLEAHSIDLRQLVGDLLVPFRLRAEKKGLVVRCAIDPSIPATVWGDPLRLRQILGNLVSNAIKFTERGEVVVNVDRDHPSIWTGGCLFSVRDSGIGIPRDAWEHIFRPFAQADASTTRKHGGTGLGLSICTQLVGMMGGRIWLESTPGAGTTFYFTAYLGEPTCELPPTRSAAELSAGARFEVPAARETRDRDV